jgi:hypothetical protein
VFEVEPGRRLEGDKELGAVGVGARVGHRQEPRVRVGQPDLLIREFRAIDRPPSRAILHSDVSTLHHETRNHTVEYISLKSQIMYIVSCAEGSEILSCLGDLGLE